MPHVKRLTPVLVVDAIEPALEFWVARLGFAAAITVPDGERLAFAALVQGGIEVMYQTHASVERDAPPEMLRRPPGPAYLYLEVTDLDAVKAALAGVPLVMPERLTFYGMREFAVREPGGHFITFAQPA